MQKSRARAHICALLGVLFCMGTVPAETKAEDSLQSRDRALDGLAGSLIFTRHSDNSNLSDSSIAEHEKGGDFLAARGVAANNYETLRNDQKIPASMLKDATDTLERLDKRVDKIPTEELRSISARYRFNPVLGVVSIAYDYEIYTRAKTPQERAGSARALCMSLVNSGRAQKDPDNPDNLFRAAVHYCIEAATNYANLSDFDQLKFVDDLTDVVMSLQPVDKKQKAEFIGDVFPAATLNPIVADRLLAQIRNGVSMQLTFGGNGLTDLTYRKMLFALIDKWLELANRLGNKKEAGLALFNRGNLHERFGEFNAAAGDYKEAHKRLEEVGYLARKPDFAEQLERNTEFNQPGGPLGLAHRSEKNALKQKDFLGAAKAEDALANIYARLQLQKERTEALSKMVENAKAAKSKELTARAKYLIAMTGKVVDQSGQSQRDRLLEAADLYRQIGDVRNEALAVSGVLTTGQTTPEDTTRAINFAKRSNQLGLVALLTQFNAVADIGKKSYETARANAQTCREAYASIHADEQVAHCEVLLAEIDKALDNKEAACGHLVTARDLFQQQGFPSRVLQQNQKMKNQNCGI